MSSLSEWSRAPDKVSRFGDMPVMMWLKPGELRALCGEIEISVVRKPSLSERPYQIEVSGGSGDERFFQRAVSSLEDEPDSEFFEGFVLSQLEGLSRTGVLYGVVNHAHLE